jgi:hypothetical protein
MKIAFCLYGFARIIHQSEHINTFLKKSFDGQDEIDIYWYCPNTIDSKEKIEIDESNLINIFKETKARKITIKFYKYDPTRFYDKVIKLGFSKAQISKNEITVSRKFSTMYHISKSIELAKRIIEEENLNYDYILLTRNDYIGHIENYGIPRGEIKEGIFCFRTSPYRTSYEQTRLEGLLDTDDRCFFGSQVYMIELAKLYDSLDILFKSENLNTESTITSFFFEKFGKEKCYCLDNLVFNRHFKFQGNRNVSQEELNYYLEKKYFN